jgi:hypothetical protein
MRLSKKELEWVRNGLLAARALRNTSIPLRATVWEPWKESFLTKITDELYPQEMDQI